MKKLLPALTIVFLAGLLWNCGSKEQKKPDPNIGGFGMPRGLVSKTEQATPGYVLFNPLNSGTTYLVNMDGQVVRTWESTFGPSGGLYIKENGNLVRAIREPSAPVYGGGGQGGRFQEITWDGELIWDYVYASENYLAHHDFALMPNGNILAIAWEGKTVEECIQAGKNPNHIPKAGLWPDKIVELKPIGKNDAEVVWEWHMWDHLIQDFDSTKANFGNPSDHPELININVGGHEPRKITQGRLDTLRSKNNAVTNATVNNGGSDMYHTNAIDYNSALDQIVISSPALDEILIIDHSTTTAEAAAHRGGKMAKGGDFLYRWGNPENFGGGDSTNHRLGGQHDVKWIADGMPGAGHIMVFNNNVPYSKKPHSAVFEIVPPLTETGYGMSNGRYGPDEPIWKFVASDSLAAYSPFISGAHRMVNGNTLVAVGAKGRFMEVTPDGKTVWDYWQPFVGNVKMKDGTSPQPAGNLVYAAFRATHIPIDHPAVKGKDLPPLNPQPEVYKEEKPK